MSGLLAALLPATVETAEAYGDLAGPLGPAESAYIARAVEPRRREFVTGRTLARTALARLGHPGAELAVGGRGEPCWPPGVVGSITHTEGYRAAAVAATVTGIEALGIDAEPAGPLPPGVLDVAAVPAERAMLAALSAGRADVPWDRLLFSAKEAVFKAWYPRTGQWLDHPDVRVVLGPEGQALRAAVHGGPVVHGRWTQAGGLLVTAVVIPGSGR